ncbi:zeta toxin family protein [Bacillus cereus]|uniref:zeta toxin family protein n=1 Tax=Bacillus cereus TaxID=1396 RepID=UPI000B4B5FDF|nr:zeta toxin family protein [Bacillus cereus]
MEKLLTSMVIPMNNTNEFPIMFVLAGNNGSGKSTVRRALLEKRLDVKINVDPDLLAKKYKMENEKTANLKGGREAIRLVEKLIEEKESFSYETTLSGKTAIQRIKKAKENGYKIMMYFVGIEDVSLNVIRVEVRKNNGGHFIPKEDILRRSKLIMGTLIENLDLYDYLQVLDNSGEKTRPVLEFDNSKLIFCSEEIPSWCNELAEILRKEEK